ncbi:MAG: hypothetical protein WBA28_04750 [Microbacteriaceae bacterium]
MNDYSRPLRFNKPPHWPTPTVEWEVLNLGWIPPIGWAPLPGVRPAPSEWTFWVHNEPDWTEYAREVRAPYVKKFWIWAGIAILGIVLTTSSLSNTNSGPAVIFVGAIIFGALRAIIALVMAIASTNDLESKIQASAKIGRELAYQKIYQQYLQEDL